MDAIAWCLRAGSKEAVIEQVRFDEATSPGVLIDSFRKVAALAGACLPDTDVVIQSLPAPHRSPRALPLGWMAVYVFYYRDSVLTIGKTGPTGSDSYGSRHYTAGTRGTLAASLLRRGREIGVDGLSADSLEDWIRNNISRVNFLIRAKAGTRVLALLEAFLRCKLQPQFDG